MKKIFLILMICYNLILQAQTYSAIGNTCAPNPQPIIVICDNLNRVSIGAGAYNFAAPGNLEWSPRNTFIGAQSGNGITTINLSGVQVGRNDFQDNTFVGALSGSGLVNPSAYTMIGTRAGLNCNTAPLLLGTRNTFFVNSNTFVGTDAGANSTGATNCFLGHYAGFNSRQPALIPIMTNNNTFNNFFGEQTGMGTVGRNNCFFGSWDGTGHNPFAITFRNNIDNCFFGVNAGSVTNGGNQNAFMGSQSGLINSIGANNVFIGMLSGSINTAGNGNTFIGQNSGVGNATGNSNVTLGSNTNFIGANLTNAVAIGANSSIAQNNSMLLGALQGINGFGYMHVGINTNTPGNSALGQGFGAQFHIAPSIDAAELDATWTNSGQTHSRIRFQNLPFNINDSAEVVVINPETGKLYRRAWNWDCCNNTGGGTPFTSCPTPNWVPKAVNATSQTCSQIYDNNVSLTEEGMANTCVMIGFHDAATKSCAYNIVQPDGTVWGTTTAGTNATGNLKLDVNGVVKGVAFLSTSDKRFKKDIKPITSALDKIKQLNGVTYNWRKDEFKNLNFDNSNQIGFIAQDVEKVIPQAVIKDGEGYYGMNYTMLIPVLTEAMKEQQKMIEQQQKEIDELKALVNGNTTKPIIGNPAKSIQLFQNVPNPFSKETDIKFFLPETVKQANLTIYDMQGKQLRKIDINERNEASIKINAKELPAGMYMYSLIADGKEMDTKRMILTDY